MPRYKSNIDLMIYDKDVSKMYSATNIWLHRVLISLCWITGARTSEIIDIRKEDVNWNDEYFGIKIKTLKLRNDGKFKIRDRILRFKRVYQPRNIYVETIIKHCSKLIEGSRLIPYNADWCGRTIGKISKKAIGRSVAPYHFRHSVCTAMAVSGFTIPEIMYFKGAISLSGVTPYIHAKPFMLELQRLDRSGDNILQTSGGSQLVTDVPTVKAYLNNVSIEKNDKIEQEDNKKDE